jgi:hypothetical protein
MATTFRKVALYTGELILISQMLLDIFDYVRNDNQKETATEGPHLRVSEKSKKKCLFGSV